jgi:cytolysin-activating lysine-acyltransferase
MENARSSLSAKALQAASKSSGGTKVPGSTPRARPADARQLRFAHTFANIVAVLMRDPGFRNLRLGELEWLVLPPVMSGQWRLAQATPAATAGKPRSNQVVPVAVALWASVSDEIDKRLSKNLDKPLILKADEWASGKNVWLVAAAGDARALPKFLKTLAETDFKDRQVKLRARGAEGKTIVTTLDAFAASKQPSK